MTNINSVACGRCGRELGDIEEHQESMRIEFRAGYGSVFGDGNVVSGTLCQYCVRELLGPYLVIREDDPFEPKIKLRPPKKAFQPYQLESEGCANSPGFRRPTEAEVKDLVDRLNDDQAW